jgi:site-specific recombinase XerD
VEQYRQFLLCVPPKNARFYTLLSVDQALRIVRQFFHWAVERRHLLFSPTAGLKLPRIETRMPKLSVEEVQKAIEAAVNVRDRAVIETFYRAGVRRAECIRLKLSDLNLKRRQLRVRGRNGERFVPIDDELAHTLERYLDGCRPLLVEKAKRRARSALFLSNVGTRYSIGSLDQMMQRLTARIGFRVSAHILRHTGAVHMIERGVDRDEVQRLLGHSSRHRVDLYEQAAAAALERKTVPRPLRYARPLTHFSSLIEDVDAG